MTITSFYYLLLLLAGVLLYYVLPRSWQWVELLVMSLFFYFTAATPHTILFLVISTGTAYVAGIYAEKKRDELSSQGKTAAVLVTAAILINIGLWFLFKGTNILISVFHVVGVDTFDIQLRAALGMGYYTLQVIGYILDCYWGNAKPQKNPLKLFLFVSFFPQLTTGPISRYHQLEGLFSKHEFSYKNLCFGAQRILWGFFKKLVLAERAGIIVNGIWGEPDIYTGFYRWIALLLFPIQMYADFSGCMDIVIGTAELFGICLPENFNSPFFSRTVQEFWQRWHITLGAWAKDYVLYPLLKSNQMVKFSKKARKSLGKQWGKFVTTAIGMLFLWIVMGVWHGAFKYIVGVSLWYWCVLMLGEVCAPVLKKISAFFRIPTESFSWHLFQAARTYSIYAVGAVFFRAASISDGFTYVMELGAVFHEKTRNPWIFFDESILKLGVSYQDINMILFAVLLMIIVGVLREKHGYAREWIARQILPFRWFVWLGLLILILIYGSYGPGYSATEFIYQGF